MTSNVSFDISSVWYIYFFLYSSLENSPLTIIYNGKVLVFDNIPAAKAKDLLQMANKGSIAAQTNIPAASAVQNTPNPSGETPFSSIPLKYYCSKCFHGLIMCMLNIHIEFTYVLCCCFELLVIDIVLVLGFQVSQLQEGHPYIGF